MERTSQLLIGEALRMIRSRKEVTQEALAQLTGLSINFLSQVENGKKGVSQAMIERIAGALEIPASFLYLLADQSENPLVLDLRSAVLASLAKGDAGKSPNGQPRWKRQPVLS